MNDYQTIRYQRHQDIGTLTLARPGKRNAQNPLMWAELARLGAELVPDETLRCLVVTGDGPTFSAGIDLVDRGGDLQLDPGPRLRQRRRRTRPRLRRWLAAGAGVRFPHLRGGRQGRAAGDPLRDHARHGRHGPAAPDHR